MRVLLRVLAPLLGLAVAVAGVVLVIEVVAAWVFPDAAGGLLVPWPGWLATVEDLGWNSDPVPAVAIGVAIVGLLLMLVGLTARRSDVVLDAPSAEMAVTTSPRVLARLVGRRVRATDDVAAASVTASRGRVAVAAQAWGDSGATLHDEVRAAVDTVLTELPLHRRPRVTVTVQDRGPR